MIEFESPLSMSAVIYKLEQIIGPRQYWLHNRVGGVGWSVSIKRKDHRFKTIITIEDPVVATFVQLKLGG